MGSFLRKDKDKIKADLDHVFELFPLKERVSQKGGHVALGGEQQMLAMAPAHSWRSDAAHARRAVDVAPVVVETIFEIIQKLNSQGSHDLARRAEREPRARPTSPTAATCSRSARSR